MPLVTALLEMDRPRSRLIRLRNPDVVRLLQSLANGDIPLTHEGLHQQTPWRTVAHLRDLLMDSGVLPRVDRQLMLFQRSFRERLATIEDSERRRLLHRFATRNEEAVLREVAEETGLLTAAMVRKAAVEDKLHSDTGQPRRTSFFFLQASADTSDAWDHQVNGDGDDAGVTFACRFLPFPLEQPLADDQDAWLGHIDPRWTTVTVGSQ
ncbi:NUDIX domain-containing protein [Streptomyces kasugaensis]|uniref:NUDIX domain-containing protein n=1 Tax=Streptomyces kasugaensis TaxID=1946 RepID=UPI001A93C77C|nr:NUDIX domain-containing protein [Streptomyces kasugaensis]